MRRSPTNGCRSRFFSAAGLGIGALSLLRRYDPAHVGVPGGARAAAFPRRDDVWRFTPDVAAVHGDQFRDSGFELRVLGWLRAGHDLAVFAWSTEAAGFVAPKSVRVTVQ